MRNSAWIDLINLIDGKKLNYNPVGFIIDSPWIPGWYGISKIDFYSSDELWLKSNLKAINTFPDVWFLPSFWSEYGMCTEPSAFGSRMIFLEKSLPHAEKILAGIEGADSLPQPNVKTDGLLPFMISRLKNNQEAIISAGHQIRFAVARGPLNIASFLMGTTEFMMATAMDPEGTHRLLKKIFSCTGAKVRFLHNDADGIVTAKYLKEMGINMFNFSFEHPLGLIRELAGPAVVLVGNIPPRDVLAGGTPQQVKAAVIKAFGEIKDYSRIIWSAGGGMPPDVKTENISALIDAVKEQSKDL